MSWTVKDVIFDPSKIELNGNKYLLSNGYMGYRGTLEEFTKDQFTGCILAGVYDQVGEQWREPISAPNCLQVQLFCDDQLLTVLDGELSNHVQSLDIQTALHTRESTFQRADNTIMVRAERFLSVDDVHLMVQRYTFSVKKACTIRIEAGIDGDVWDINGPHLTNMATQEKANVLFAEALTNEQQKRIIAAERIRIGCGSQSIKRSASQIARIIELTAQPGIKYSLERYASIYTDNDNPNPKQCCVDSLNRAYGQGYETLFRAHRNIWSERWKRSDVQIEGDLEAQFALRYSIYHLLSAAPVHSDCLSIPARGLSSQVYKGAIFWDTELYMLPFFIYTFPEVARNIVNYRITTLDGAREKAREYGYRGAFYAWESQDGGKDACTHFNVNDVFTGRPLRTYFRDKQIHISADVVYGIWQYYQVTGDCSIILGGGAEAILECARFFLSYAYFKKDLDRYEILDVTGPDEYHERVNNNAYTNMMAKYTVKVALKVLDILKKEHSDNYEDLLKRLNYAPDLASLKDFYDSLYIQEPNEMGIIEQFDGYFKLEDVSLDELQGRIAKKNEYLGGPAGLATTTQILKQSDTVLMLNQFRDYFSESVKRANWEYYEPRTEHGSSLSSCVYAMLAAHLGKVDYAYEYFMKTATIDLSGQYKQYVGDLFIGGTHLASNGGAWLATVLGFAGMSIVGGKLSFSPCLPDAWKKLSFNIQVKGKTIGVEIVKDQVILRNINTLSA